MNLIEELKSSQAVFEGRLLKVYRDVVTLFDGREEIREVIRHPGAVVVIPHLGDGEYALVRQYRYAIRRETLEFPAGRLESREASLECARRELNEETGYSGGHWTPLFLLHPAPGYTDELLHFFLAENLRAGSNHPDTDEQLQVVTAHLDQLLTWFFEGKITDAKTCAALLFLKLNAQIKIHLSAGARITTFR